MHPIHGLRLVLIAASVFQQLRHRSSLEVQSVLKELSHLGGADAYTSPYRSRATDVRIHRSQQMQRRSTFFLLPLYYLPICRFLKFTFGLFWHKFAIKPFYFPKWFVLFVTIWNCTDTVLLKFLLCTTLLEDVLQWTCRGNKGETSYQCTADLKEQT